MAAIEAEAARLLLKARASEAAEDWSTAYAWVALDPAHGPAFAKAEASWELTERLLELPASQIGNDVRHSFPSSGEEGTQEDAQSGERPLFKRRQALKWAAAAGTIAILAPFAFSQFAAADQYRTTVGETRSIRLPDGSEMNLNTDTAVEVAFRDDRRSVTLLRGEARFDVAHDEKRPFIVTASQAQVRAVGTIFNVRLRSDVTELTVIEGIVAVEDNGSAIQRIESGRSAAVRGGSIAVTPLDPLSIKRRLSWQTGLLQFDGDTLAQAVEEFNRYRMQPIVIGDPAIASLRVGGTFQINRSRDFVTALESSFGVRAVMGGDDSILLVAAD